MNQGWETRNVPKKQGKPKKAVKKDSQLILRLNKDERDAFIELCKDLDTTAAREIRRFIRGYLEEHDSVPESKTETEDA